jgi:photosystem II stability/assembly factor-like uncharacterized protein
MKNFTYIMVLIFLGLSNATIVAQGTWNELQINPTAKAGESMQFVSATEGWISLSSNQLLHTTNGGNLWSVVTPNSTDVSFGIDAPGSRISFINPSIGWAMKTLSNSNEDALGVVLYKTTDGGANWIRTVLSTTANDAGIQVQFVDANNGWVLIFNMGTGIPKFLKTTDGGANWTTTNGGGIFYYVNATTGYAFTAGPEMIPPYYIMKTTDGGASWTPQYTDNTAGELNAILFTDVNNGWIVGKNGKVFKTTNGGTNWTFITNTGYTTNYDNSALSFINSSTGWIASKADGSNPFMLTTTNGGASWSTEPIPFNSKVYSMDFWDANNGWATSDSYNNNGIDYPGQIAKYGFSTGTYSNATLNGPWFMYTNVTPIDPYNDNLNYFVFDGNGNITDFNGFGGPWTGSTYSVSPSGAISGTLTNGSESFSFGGQLTSETEGIAVGDGQNWKFHKVANPGALKDKITGTLTTVNCGNRNVTLNIDSNGVITSAIGLAGPVTGSVYADLGVYIGHMTTAEGNDTHWGELSIMGYYSNNDLVGHLGLDDSSQNPECTNTTSNLVRSDNTPVNTDWTLQTNPMSGTAKVGAMQFVSANEGWISIAPGGLLHTIDGGTTWTETILHPTDVIGSPSDPALNLSFISATTGWVLKTFGTFENPLGAVVYKTTNGGANWERKVVSTIAGDLGFELQFVDANTGWLLIYNFNTFTATFLKTTDGGTNWIPTNGAGIFSYIDANNGWAYSSSSQGPPYTIYKTTNGGANWTPIATENTAGEIGKMIFTDLNNGWIVGKNGKILKTTNGGFNWIPITNTGITSQYNSKNCYFMNATTGWIGAEPDGTNNKRDESNNYAIILHTKDGGISWTTQTTPTRNPFSIFFWDESNGWFTSDDNKIARYTSTLDVKENVVNKFVTIYPNPNNGTFYFSLKDTNSKVKVEIFTLLGQKVFEASNFEMQPQNQINFAPQSKGIYLIKINDGENSYSEKIMIQ